MRWNERDKLDLPDPREWHHKIICIQVPMELPITPDSGPSPESPCRIEEFESVTYAILYPPTKSIPRAEKRVGFAWKHLETGEIWRNRKYMGPIEPFDIDGWMLQNGFGPVDTVPDDVVWD